jgi:ABC-2 type transport system permease protein
VAVVVPPDAEQSIRDDTHAEIEVLHNRIDPIDTTFLLFFAQTGVDEINQEVFRRLIEGGRAEATAAGVPDPAEEISAEVLVSPFVAVVDHVKGVSIDYSTFYVPGVVALLLQHMALTFAALSLVRERTLGTTELFRVSPLSGGEVLLGKYLAYTLLGTLTGAALVTAAHFGFGFDVAGDWWWFLILSTLVLIAAQGAGFVVSGVARTESEAVQYSMIMLLVAMFFSGFILSIERLIWPVRAVSYLIPATYGIKGLQDVAFRGEAPSPETVLGVAALALALLAAAWALIRRRVMQAQQSV